MPELEQDSTNPPPPPRDPLFEDPPPLHDPDSWEAFPVFRETFLMYVTPLGYSTALRVIGQMLYDLVLEPPIEWPEWGESATRREMRAAAADLRHVQGFLASIGQERKVSSLSTGDKKLSKFAGDTARVLNQIANRIERKLAKEAAS
jgi:hypothetical protein